MGWALVIGLTGAINAFADPLTALRRQGELAAMVAAAAREPVTDPARRASLDGAMAAAQAAQPGLSPQFIGFPGGAWSSNHHYAVFFQGDTPWQAGEDDDQRNEVQRSYKAAPYPLGQVNRQFHAPAPNMLWVSDFTYVATWAGFV